MEIGKVALMLNVILGDKILGRHAGTLGVEINENMITDLPLNGRNLLNQKSR